MLTKLSKHHVTSDTAFGISPEYFQYPEKILQFGTGVLLRGLVDYLVDKANKQGIFQGRIVVVKSTDGSTADFDSQDSLFTTHIKGKAKGELVNRQLVNASISRVLQSNADWDKVLTAIRQPQLDIIISNTTEVGIQYVEEKVDGVVPASYPGKLLSVLLERYRCFNGDAAKGFTIIPTELVVDNGRLLKEIVLKLAAHNELPADFINWINTANTFCSSLVDRIVPGKPKDLVAQNETAGYEDSLWIEAEPFLLWAIEGSEKVAGKLSFKQADERMLVAESITPYREQKLRILNGSHTAAVAVGYLSGLNTVYECMQNPVMKRFFETVVLEEILPTLKDLGPQTAVFAKDVLDRFANPFIEHKLLSITFQQSSKTNTRNVRTLLRYYEQKKMLPPMISIGLAASILFIKPVRQEGGKYQGQRGDVFYDINDDNAAIFAAHWNGIKINEKAAVSGLVHQILGDIRLWETDLNEVPGFSESITDHLYGMLQEGVNAYVSNFSKVH